MKLISIIIPVYNGGKYIGKGINSILKQTIGIDKIEVIIVDDKSTDDTLEMLDQYANKYKNAIKVIKLEENTGHSSIPRNVGIENATGKYIMFMDQDDWFKRDACEKLIKAMEKNKCDFVIGWYESKNAAKHCTINELKRFDKLEDSKELLEMKVGPSIWCKLYKKEIIDHYKIRYPGYALAEDLVFYLEYGFRSNGIVSIPEVVYHYNIRDEEDLSVFNNRKEGFFVRLSDGFNDVWQLLEKLDKTKYFDSVIDIHINSYLVMLLNNQLITSQDKIKLFQDIRWILDKIDRKLIFKNIQILIDPILDEDNQRLMEYLEFENLYQVHMKKIIERKIKEEDKLFSYYKYRLLNNRYAKSIIRKIRGG